jgi:hypothetical protein
MPQNGEINRTFSVYKSLCCDREIVVREGATFPDCPNHLRLTTIWKLLPTEFVELRPVKKSNTDSAA